jgi:hypothetical protein
MKNHYGERSKEAQQIQFFQPALAHSYALQTLPLIEN